MDKIELNKVINKYAEEHPESWVGLHDSHNIELPKKILDIGLCVSHNPYGKRGRNTPVSHNFMATMHHVTERQPVSLPVLPVAPVLIDIPKEILDLFNATNHDYSSYQYVCLYGHQSLKETTDEFGWKIFVRGDITPLETEEGANVRLLPPCFVVGYYNVSTDEFINNPKHFYNLTKK